MHHLEENIMSLFQLDLWQESVRNINDSWEGLIFMLYGVRQGVAFTLQRLYLQFIHHGSEQVIWTYVCPIKLFNHLLIIIASETTYIEMLSFDD